MHRAGCCRGARGGCVFIAGGRRRRSRSRRRRRGGGLSLAATCSAGARASTAATCAGTVRGSPTAWSPPKGRCGTRPRRWCCETGAATITWDLGQVTTVRAAWVQADANDNYTVWGSLDGERFTRSRAGRDRGRAARPARPQGVPGWVCRPATSASARGRGTASIRCPSCSCSARYPRRFRPRCGSRTPRPPRSARNIFTYWNNETSARWEFFLALLGLALLQWGLQLGREGRPQRLPQAARRLAGGRAASCGADLHQFRLLPFRQFHSRLGMDPLLHGLEILPGAVLRPPVRMHGGRRHGGRPAPAGGAAQDDQPAHQRPRVQRRDRRPPRTLQAALQPRPLGSLQARRAIFPRTPERQALGRPADRSRIQRNTGLERGRHAAGQHGAASKGQLYTLALLDPLYLAGTIAVVWWAFGWRVLCVGLLVFATNFPSRYYWTGGSYLRWDWLFYTVAAICCLRKERPVLGGAALAYATLLRVFPGFVFAGPLLGLGLRSFANRRRHELEPPAGCTQFFLGAALATALLVPLSLAVSGGVRRLPAFRAEHRQAQGDAAHQLHGAAHGAGLAAR